MNKIEEQQILSTLAGPIWRKVGLYPHHGIDLHLASLHSKNSCGIGEFLDLIPVIDWCQKIGFDVIQLLPLNDSGNDPSPYNAQSSCALNPIFLSLHTLPHLEHFPELKDKLIDMQALCRAHRIPYHNVQSRKMKWLRDYHDKVASQLADSEDLFDFISHNDWVKPYALFKVLKNQVQQNSWLTWPEEWKDLTDEEFDELLNIHKEEVSFHTILQYLCFQELAQVKKYAEEKQVLIKGDIPILISPDSADVWTNLEFFDLSLAAGAPPDAYNPKGQYWGFPLYRWDIKKRSHFRWWKQRLGAAAHFYDCYRIDHVVGFFRIWAIKPGHLPKEGKFVPEDEDQWLPQGRELLEMLVSSSNMLPIAEDLGTVPDCVKPCLEELGICGTKVMRWERRWKTDNSVIPIDEYPVLSLTCVSTHDSDTLQQWWKKFPDEAEVFAADKGWEYHADLSIPQRKEILWDSHHTPSLFHINLLQEYFALFPELVARNPDEERINVPGEVLPTNWTYRFRPSIEEFTFHEKLSIAMKELIK